MNGGGGFRARLCTAFLLLAAGCAGTADFRPQAQSSPGLTALYQHPRAAVFPAAAAAAADLGLVVQESAPDGAYLIAEQPMTLTKNPVLVGVYLEEERPGATRVRVVSKAKISTQVFFVKDYGPDLHARLRRRALTPVGGRGSPGLRAHFPALQGKKDGYRCRQGPPSCCSLLFPVCREKQLSQPPPLP